MKDLFFQRNRFDEKKTVKKKIVKFLRFHEKKNRKSFHSQNEITNKLQLWKQAIKPQFHDFFFVGSRLKS